MNNSENVSALLSKALLGLGFLLLMLFLLAGAPLPVFESMTKQNWALDFGLGLLVLSLFL